MSFLITGGTGFIASHVARKLVSTGEDVVLFDLFPDGEMIRDIRERVKIVQGDVTSLADVVQAVRGFNVKFVIHMAYYFTRPSQRNPLKATKINCEGTANIFEASRLSGVEKVVWASSCAVFGPSKEYSHFPITEKDRTRPTTLYGACKVYDEFISEVYRKQHGLQTTGIRVSGAYGWGMWKRRDSVVNFLFDLFEKGARGEKCLVRGGDIVFDWQYVKDLADAFVLACRKRTKGGIFNSTGHLHKVKEAVQIFRELVPNRRIEVSSEPPAEEGAEGDYLRIDASLIRKELGYKPRYGLREGISDYLRDLKSLG